RTPAGSTGNRRFHDYFSFVVQKVSNNGTVCTVRSHSYLLHLLIVLSVLVYLIALEQVSYRLADDEIVGHLFAASHLRDLAVQALKHHLRRPSADVVCELGNRRQGWA